MGVGHTILYHKYGFVSLHKIGFQGFDHHRVGIWFRVGVATIQGRFTHGVGVDFIRDNGCKRWKKAKCLILSNRFVLKYHRGADYLTLVGHLQLRFSNLVRWKKTISVSMEIKPSIFLGTQRGRRLTWSVASEDPILYQGGWNRYVIE